MKACSYFADGVHRIYYANMTMHWVCTGGDLLTHEKPSGPGVSFKPTKSCPDCQGSIVGTEGHAGPHITPLNAGEVLRTGRMVDEPKAEDEDPLRPDDPLEALRPAAKAILQTVTVLGLRWPGVSHGEREMIERYVMRFAQEQREIGARAVLDDPWANFPSRRKERGRDGE